MAALIQRTYILGIWHNSVMLYKMKYFGAVVNGFFQYRILASQHKKTTGFPVAL